jgi:hypothetical protein
LSDTGSEKQTLIRIETGDVKSFVNRNRLEKEFPSLIGWIDTYFDTISTSLSLFVLESDENESETLCLFIKSDMGRRDFNKLKKEFYGTLRKNNLNQIRSVFAIVRNL